MARARAADDFPTIRARLEELRREQADLGKTGSQSDPPKRPYRSIYWPEMEVSAGPERVRQSGPIRG
jgi:hypothetical protein